MISKLTEIRCNEVDQVKRPLKPGNNPVERSIQLKGPRRSLARQTMNKKIAKGSRIKSPWIRVATEFWRFLKPNRTSKLIKIRAMDHLVDGSMAAASTSYKHDMVDCLVVFFLSFFLSLSLSLACWFCLLHGHASFLVLSWFFYVPQTASNHLRVDLPSFIDFLLFWAK